MTTYFVHDAFNSDVEYFETKEEALKHAKDSIGDGSDGWAQELLDGAIKIGVVTHESSKTNERDTENKEWDFECECEMVEIDDSPYKVRPMSEEEFSDMFQSLQRSDVKWFEVVKELDRRGLLAK